MQKRILTFIVRDRKILTLYSKPHPEHCKGGWIVVTGEVNEEESHKEAVTREIMEETGLTIKENVFLNWGFIYNWNKDICKEPHFISFVDTREVILNKKHNKYERSDDKKLLKKVLIEAMERKKNFEKLKTKNYRIKNE